MYVYYYMRTLFHSQVIQCRFCLIIYEKMKGNKGREQITQVKSLVTFDTLCSC